MVARFVHGAEQTTVVSRDQILDATVSSDIHSSCGLNPLLRAGAEFPDLDMEVSEGWWTEVQQCYVVEVVVHVSSDSTSNSRHPHWELNELVEQSFRGAYGREGLWATRLDLQLHCFHEFTLYEVRAY